MKRLLLATLCLWASGLFAQSGINEPALSITGQPLQSSPVRVCQAGSTGNPCLPLANIFSDWAEAQPIIQPGFTTDPQGNIVFYAPVGRYDIQVYDTGNVYTYHNIIAPPAASGGGGCGGSNCITSTGLTSGYVPVATGSLTQVNSSIQDNGSTLVSTPENFQSGTLAATAGIQLLTTTGTTTIQTVSGDTGTTVDIPPSLGTVHMATADALSGYSTLLGQKFFGAGVPGSVSGNLPGDLYSDTTNHNLYWCGAASGTSAPACTTVASTGWVLANTGGGGGSGNVTTSGLTSNSLVLGVSTYGIVSSAIYANYPASGDYQLSPITPANTWFSSGTGAFASDFPSILAGGANHVLKVAAGAIGSFGVSYTTAGTGDTDIPIWVAGGKDGAFYSIITTSGLATCQFDAGGSTSGDYVGASTTTASDCMDLGVSSYTNPPPTGKCTVGIAMQTQTGAGLYIIVASPQCTPSTSTPFSYHTQVLYTLTGSDSGSNVATATIDTPGSATFYDVGVQIVQTNTPASCTGGATVAARLDYTNADNSLHITGANNMALWTENSGNTAGNLGASATISTAGAPGNGQAWDGVVRRVHVAASTSLVMYLTVASDTLASCSPYPIVSFTPIVTKVP